MNTTIQASAALVWSFAALGLLVAAAVPFGIYAAGRRLGGARRDASRHAVIGGVVVALWLALTLLTAATGRLAFGPLPPPMGVLFVVIVVGAVLLARSGVGRQLAEGVPLAALVGFHGFRLPLELLMHQAYTEGVMPVQMSYSGLNFDIATGASAIVVALLIAMGRMPSWGVRLWNIAGSLLLMNIVTIAWLSTPTPLRVFHNEPANVWITQPPFVWLPAVMVFSAMLGHLLVYRRLRIESRGRRIDSATTSTEVMNSVKQKAGA